MKEEYRDIEGYEGYQVSNLGNIKSIARVVIRKNGIKYTIKERILKPRIAGSGYNYVKLSQKKNISVHKLVAIAFLNYKVDGKYKIVCDHIDNNKLNNKLDNLQIITHRENLTKDKVGGTSKYVGVSFNKNANKYKSTIHYNGVNHHLGYFINEYDAHIVYQDALSKLVQ